MRIVTTLDVMLAGRKMRPRIAGRVGVTDGDFSLLRTGKVKGVRFLTLAKICEALDCKPGDLLDIEEGEPSADGASQAPGGCRSAKVE